ncbi:MAG: hemerythrin domain-containing protein [bacterium]
MDILWEIEFSDEYLTNVEIIDNSHKDLAMRANKLYEMSTGLNTKEADLVKYIEESKQALLGHFEEEIALYKKYNLPTVEEHNLKHEEIKNYVNELDLEPHPILVKAMMMNQIILRYLVQHLYSEDKKCIEMIKKSK